MDDVYENIEEYNLNKERNVNYLSEVGHRTFLLFLLYSLILLHQKILE